MALKAQNYAVCGWMEYQSIPMAAVRPPLLLGPVPGLDSCKVHWHLCYLKSRAHVPTYQHVDTHCCCAIFLSVLQIHMRKHRRILAGLGEAGKDVAWVAYIQETFHSFISFCVGIFGHEMNDRTNAGRQANDVLAGGARLNY